MKCPGRGDFYRGRGEIQVDADWSVILGHFLRTEMDDFTCIHSSRYTNHEYLVYELITCIIT